MIVIWLVVAIVAAIGEVLTTGLFLGTVAVAALATAIVSIFVPSTTIELALFAVLALLGVTVLRPILWHGFGIEALVHAPDTVMHSHIVGRRAAVTRTVDAYGGQIRIGEGEFWSARAYGNGDPIAPGTQVEVVLVEGLTALVATVDRLTALEQESHSLPNLPTDKGA